MAGPGWDLLLVTDGRPDDAGSGWGVMFTTVGDVYRGPCDVSKGTIPAAQVDTPQKLSAAITAWPEFTTTATRPINVDGHGALELKIAKKARSGGCATGTTWLSSSGTAVDAYPFADGSAYPTTIRIVDTGRGRGLLVIRRATSRTRRRSRSIPMAWPTPPTGTQAIRLRCMQSSTRSTSPPPGLIPTATGQAHGQTRRARGPLSAGRVLWYS